MSSKSDYMTHDLAVCFLFKKKKKKKKKKNIEGYCQATIGHLNLKQKCEL